MTRGAGAGTEGAIFERFGRGIITAENKNIPLPQIVEVFKLDFYRISEVLVAGPGVREVVIKRVTTR